jgi:hypothetical protein
MVDKEQINDKSSYGFQSGFGVPGTADKQLPSVSIVPDTDGSIRAIETVGEEFPTGSQHGVIRSALAIDGGIDFVSIGVLLEALYGTVTPDTVGVTGKRRVYTPSATKPRYFTNDYGDSVRFQRAVDCFVTDLSLHGTLEETTLTGSAIGQALLDSVIDSLTLASASLLTQKTPDPLKSSLRRATSLAGLDTASPFGRGFVWDCNIAGRWSPLHAMNAALGGRYDAVLRKKPSSADGMIQVGADDDGWGYWTRAKNNTIDYLRYDIIGDTIAAGTAEVQTLEFTGGPTAGDALITLPASYGSGAQGPVTAAFNISAAAMQSMLNSLPRIAAFGGVTVTRAGAGSAGSPYIYTITANAGLGNIPTLTSTHTFTGGTTPSTTHGVTTPGVDPIRYLLQVDMAVASREFPTRGSAPSYAEGLDVLDVPLWLMKTSTLNGLQITLINETATY